MRLTGDSQQSYIEWLKSLGCISYCPLQEDLEDKISGASYEYTGSGSYEFDNGWCKVTTPSTSIATTLQITIPDFQSLLRSDMSLLGELVNLGIGNCRPTLFSNVAINSESDPQWFGNCNVGALNALSVNTEYKTGRVIDYSAQKIYYYKNGVNISTGNHTYDLTQMPSPQNQGMVIGCAGHTNYRNCQFKIRNLMVFNKALSQTEVRKIQGYE